MRAMNELIMMIAALAGGCSVARCGCAIPDHTATAPVNQPAYRRFKNIHYTWEGCRVQVVFRRLAPDGAWIMSLQDSWDVFERSG